MAQSQRFIQFGLILAACGLSSVARAEAAAATKARDKTEAQVRSKPAISKVGGNIPTLHQENKEWLVCATDTDCARTENCGCGCLPTANKRFLREVANQNDYVGARSRCAAPKPEALKTMRDGVPVCRKNLCSLELKDESTPADF